MGDDARDGRRGRTGHVLDLALVARYLSPAWFEEVNAAARRSPLAGARASGARLTVQQVVTDGPEGEVRYWVHLEEGVVRTGLGNAPDADATVRQSYQTAVALVTGELSVQSALMAGRVRLSGDVGALLDHQEVLGEAGAAFADVHRHTSYP